MNTAELFHKLLHDECPSAAAGLLIDTARKLWEVSRINPASLSVSQSIAIADTVTGLEADLACMWRTLSRGECRASRNAGPTVEGFFECAAGDAALVAIGARMKRQALEAAH